MGIRQGGLGDGLGWEVDFLGSTLSATALAGESHGLFAYGAFGEATTLGESRLRFAFTGKELLGESGLLHMDARALDPVSGRFLQRDPYNFATLSLPEQARGLVNLTGATTESFVLDVYQQNGYPYVNGSPFRYVDLTGLSGCNFGPRPDPNLKDSQANFGSPGVPTYGKGRGKGFRRLFDSIRKWFRGKGRSGQKTFPKNPDDLLPELPRDSKGYIYPNNGTRIRPEKHPLKPGESYSPRHHGQHYHIETRNNPNRSWNNQKNVNKILPENYRKGEGTGHTPGEPFPGSWLEF